MMKLKTAVSALVILSLLCACTPRDTSQTDPSLPPSQTETQHPEPTSAPELKEPAKEETIPAREETDASETVPSQPREPDQEQGGENPPQVETEPAVPPTDPKEETPPEETKAMEADPPEYKPEPTEPPQTEPPQTEPPQTEPPEAVKPDTAAIEAYGRAYASSLGFVIDTSLEKGNSGYYSPDYRPLCSTEEGFSVAASMVATTKNQLNSRFSTEYSEVLVEEAYGIARCNVVVVYSHTDELGDWYYTYVFYG